jgi:hypothetical protein
MLTPLLSPSCTPLEQRSQKPCLPPPHPRSTKTGNSIHSSKELLDRLGPRRTRTGVSRTYSIGCFVISSTCRVDHSSCSVVVLSDSPLAFFLVERAVFSFQKINRLVLWSRRACTTCSCLICGHSVLPASHDFKIMLYSVHQLIQTSFPMFVPSLLSLTPMRSLSRLCLEEVGVDFRITTQDDQLKARN